MTTVAALIHEGNVYMAADSRSNVYDRPIDGVRKILRVPAGDGEILLGVCGDGALAGVLPTALKVEAPPETGVDAQPWANSVARAITEATLEARITNEAGRMDGSLILGAAGRLWTVSHMQAIPHLDNVAALGSGEGPAIGAMDALLPAGGNPVEILVHAVRIAIHRDRNSGGAVWLEVLHATKGET